MDLSLVVCTRNRAAQLPDCLKAIAATQTRHDWELVLVDNGSTDDTPAILRQFQASHGLNIRLVTEPVAGLSRARNAGWQATRGAYIAFTDDDCYIDPTYLQQIADCFDADPRLGYLGGRILLFDPTDLRITIQERTRREALLPGVFLPAGLIQGANFAFRRSALEEIGGFDEHLGAGTPFPCEDVDAIARASAAGWNGAYDPRPLVYHHHRRKTEAERDKLMAQYDHGRGAYYAKSLLRRRHRGVYAKHWLRAMRHQARGTTFREFVAAMKYLLMRARLPFRR